MKIFAKYFLGIYNPYRYLNEWHKRNEGLSGEDLEKIAVSEIRVIIGEVKKIKNKFPLYVYRGVRTKFPKSNYENSCWTLNKKIAESFGDKIFLGFIRDSKIVDWEQTIRARVLFPREEEIYIPNSVGVEILECYKK